MTPEQIRRWAHRYGNIARAGRALGIPRQRLRQLMYPENERARQRRVKARAYQANPEKFRERRRLYYAEHPSYRLWCTQYSTLTHARQQIARLEQRAKELNA